MLGHGGGSESRALTLTLHTCFLYWYPIIPHMVAFQKPIYQAVISHEQPSATSAPWVEFESGWWDPAAEYDSCQFVQP
jgi:hypothetical protein